MQKDFSKSPLRIFLSYIAGHKKLFIIDMICAVVASVIDLVFPLISRISMQNLLPKNMFAVFFAVMAVMVLTYFLKAVLYYVITLLGHQMGVLVEADMRRDIFSHMQELSFDFYDKNRTGVLMSRITTDLFDVTELAHHGPEFVLICAITMIGSMIFMFAMEWRLALVLLLTLPVCLVYTFAQRVNMKHANIEVKKKTADINAAIESSISGVRTAKAFANEDQELIKFEEANNKFRNSKIAYYKTMGTYMSGMEFTSGVAPVLVIAAGGLLIMKGRMDYIDLVTFTLYVTAFVNPLRRLTMLAELYMQGLAGFTRFVEIMRTEPQIKDAENAKELENVEGRIDIENVSFHYSNEIPVLENINLTIHEGQSVAVVGPSGGGKTTLCQLMPRFYDVCSGSIKVDGTDIRELTQSSLRRNIGIIQQDVFMFAGSIKDNIRYGRPDASDEEIIEAAKKAEIHDEIMALPQAYDSQVGERGVKLSGGQKQRLSIARVFLKNPKILILDEATSALDTVTEQHIQAALEQLSQGRTTIIIAHRLSTVKDADNIVVVDDDRIVEQGCHKELMELNGVYAALCRAQSLE